MTDQQDLSLRAALTELRHVRDEAENRRARNVGTEEMTALAWQLQREHTDNAIRLIEKDLGAEPQPAGALEWREAAKELPMDGCPVLACWNGAVIFGFYTRYGPDGAWSYLTYHGTASTPTPEEVTHWMRLPTPPLSGNSARQSGGEGASGDAN